MSYGGFHTRQEQEDVLAAQITNPNRVGSGFINLGPMQRIPQVTAAANWQTAELVGVNGGATAPPSLSDIWNKQAAPPPPPGMGSRLPPGATQHAAPQQYARPGGAFAAPMTAPASLGNASLGGVNGMFDSFSINPQARALASQQAQAAAQAQAAVRAQVVQSAAVQAQAQQARSFSAMQPSLQQPFMNGSVAGPPAPPPQAPPGSLMSMLGATAPQPPPPAPSLHASFGALGLGNGLLPAVPPARLQAAFNGSVPPVAQCQLPPQPTPGFGGVPHAFGSAPSARGAPPPAPPAPPAPKTLSSTLSTTADYGAAAAAWKPPPTSSNVSSTSVARKPETAPSASGKSSGAGTPRAAQGPSEWECRRCTFLNNGALSECEMCGFERPAKEGAAAGKGSSAPPDTAASTPRATADDDAGWKPAGRVERKGPAGQPVPSVAGKSKAQAKNEKRRAKKRDGLE
jgi:hypothetical protein